MDAEPFDERDFYRAIAHSGARALLIGRRAMVVLRLPVLTADYDYWVHPDDAAAFNSALAPLDFTPNHSPEEARSRGRYVLEQDEKVDVLLARSMPTVDGARISFDEVWSRHEEVPYAPGVTISLPTIPDLITTKRFGQRPKDIEDIRMLTALLERDRP